MEEQDLDSKLNKWKCSFHMSPTQKLICEITEKIL